MKLKTLCGALAALVVAPGISQAQFNYNYVEFEFVDVEHDAGPFDVDGDGFAISGQFEITESFFLGAAYEDYDYDPGGDGDLLKITGGYYHMMQENLDFVAELSLLDFEVGNSDDDGLALAGGLRYAVNEDIEVDAMIEHVDFDRGGSDTGIELRGRYYLNEDFAVQAQLDLAKDIETFRIGIRYEF